MNTITFPNTLDKFLANEWHVCEVYDFIDDLPYPKCNEVMLRTYMLGSDYSDGIKDGLTFKALEHSYFNL